MGDHFVLLVDRLLTESTLEAAIESKNQWQHTTPCGSEDMMTNFSAHRMDVDIGPSQRILVQCRICHDEDEDSNMEVPCSCAGSLKYAHRGCVQRWCNEKGNTTCEICHQQFRPNYTAPPPLFHYGGIPMNFRGNWEVSRRDANHPRFIAMVASDRNFLDTDIDEYPAPNSRSVICCRIVAIIFMILLVLRHTLPIIISGAGEYSFTLFTLLMLRAIGILLPVYIMVKACTAFQRRRHQQDARNLPSDEENEMQPQPRIIQIR
ncbi:hypothetical protein VitviT2T_021784 [Vitis vinifera]|uniref:RING-CH-type domain-containing protein n=3 Tax=Vitis vinifera TaxID=29760 RepID=D7TSV4_VITVI|eukprot:XP_019080651.1 PREDICTED: uncharacterized protein LOC100258737 isoform X1 [Vitis vinifera]